MTNFDFQIYLNQTEVDESQADELYACCKDGTLITADGETYMDFEREADCLEQAVNSAVADIRSIGFDVKRIDWDNQ